MTCFYCGGGRFDPLYAGVRDRYAIATGEFRFLACRTCGSAVLDPLPDAATLARAYPSEYTFKGPDSGTQLGFLRALEWRLFYRPGYRERIGRFRRLTGLRAGRVLEVGCGSGLFLRVLAEAGYTAEGLEVSEADVTYARERLGLLVARGTLENHPLPRAGYDAVVLVDVLEHVLAPRTALARIADALKPGGWIVVAVPVLNSVQARLLGGRWGAVTEAPRHVSIPTTRGVHSLFSAAGFSHVRAAPSGLLENAGYVALSLLPGAATPSTYGRTGGLRTLARRAAGAFLVMFPGLVVAVIERLTPSAWAGSTVFAGRKPGGIDAA